MNLGVAATRHASTRRNAFPVAANLALSECSCIVIGNFASRIGRSRHSNESYNPCVPRQRLRFGSIVVLLGHSAEARRRTTRQETLIEWNEEPFGHVRLFSHKEDSIADKTADASYGFDTK